jgi:nuclear GTP-binding protein
MKEQQGRYCIRMLHKVIGEVDVILLGLDARSPAGCRSRLVEEEVRGSLILDSIIVTYCNLVPRENAQQQLRHTTPTLPFRSPCPHQRTNQGPGLTSSRRTNRARRRASPLASLASLTKVGKSSLINMLKRAKVRCRVSLGRFFFSFHF